MGKKDIAIKKEKLGFRQRLTGFLRTMVMSFWPDSYTRFSQRRLMQGISYFFALLVFALLFFCILSLARLPGLLEGLSSQTHKFEALELDVDMNLTEDISLLGGEVTISEHGNYSGQTLLMTKDAIYLKDLKCISFPALCYVGGDRSGMKETSQLKDVLDYEDWFMRFLLLLLIIAIPFFVIFSAIVLMLKALFFMALAYVLCLAAAKVFGYKISLLKILLVVIYASTIYIVLSPIDKIIYPLFFAHIAAFFLYSLIGLFIAGDRRHRF